MCLKPQLTRLWKLWYPNVCTTLGQVWGGRQKARSLSSLERTVLQRGRCLVASLRGHGHRFKVSQPSAGCAFVKLRSEEKGSQASSKFPAWSSPSASLCVLLPEPFCRTLMAVFAFHTQFEIVKECDPSSNLEAATSVLAFGVWSLPHFCTFWLQATFPGTQSPCQGPHLLRTSCMAHPSPA